MVAGVGGAPSAAARFAPATRSALERWVSDLVAAPGLTALHDPAAAWAQHVEDSVLALPQLERFPGSIVDVGSGGGAPGIPLAAALPDREVTLLEASARRCDWLRGAAASFPNVRVEHGRAEEQPVDAWDVAVAKALAPPPAAAEWCLALVRPGGAAILYVTASASPEPVAVVAARLGATGPEVVELSNGRALFVLPKLAATPPGFPRRPGMARKRPLA